MTEKKHVIWHLGFQKTGTTFIQRLMAENATNIEGRVFLANKGPRTKQIRRRGVGFCELKNKNAERRLRSELSILREDFEKSAHRMMLFSDEVLLGHHVITEANDFVRSATRLLPVLEEEFDGMQSNFVFYTREFSPWMESVYNQGVKALGYKETFEEWRALYQGPTDWSLVRDRIGELQSSTIQFVPMERDRNPFLGAELLRMAGLRQDDLRSFSIPKRQNESMPKGALELLRLFNRSDLDPETLAIIRRKIRNHPEFFAKAPNIDN